MKEDITKIDGMQQEFAYVDSIITAHTNMAIAKVNAEQLQMCWEIGAYISHEDFEGLIRKLELSEFVQAQSAQLKNIQVPACLLLTTFSNHIEILNRCRTYERFRQWRGWQFVHRYKQRPSG